MVAVAGAAMEAMVDLAVVEDLAAAAVADALVGVLAVTTVEVVDITTEDSVVVVETVK